MGSVEAPVFDVEDSDVAMFDEGDFEVVDECIGEEDSVAEEKDETAKGTDSKKTAVDLGAAKAQETVSSPKKANEGSVKAGAKIPVQAKPSNGSGNNGIDFTEDVAMDNEEDAKVDPMDDEVIQLDVGDSIILEDCEDKPETGKDKADGKTTGNSDNNAAEEAAPVILPEHAWYEEKINAKSATVKERLSKLARVLELSYPTYKPWLEHSKDPVCHLDQPRRCPLDRPHTNRWKFICSRKPVQESTNKEEDSAEGTVNKKVETVWRLGPTDGSGVNTDNASQYPPFVMRVVKVFEEFIQKIDESPDRDFEESNKEEDPSAAPETETKPAASEANAKDDAAPKETVEAEELSATKDGDEAKDETADDEKGSVSDRSHTWLWLLVRCNSKDELMVFATGKKISHATMEKLKETFETGAGKDCNVKSLYCKSIARTGNTTTTNITFLAGSEALDETVAGLKIQLAPKTNFWCNASGVETLGAAVGDLLSPVPKTTVVEVGCGLGLLGLMVAPKCRQLIGLDAPSEVEEAEMTSELNKIANTTFVTGPTNDMMAKVSKLLKNTRASAIINANTKIGRAIEVMTALRKFPTLRRVVMITTLTKQSVRAILELTRPADGDLGNPFMPVRAVLVDTLPTGPHFEVVIRMERLIMQKMHEPWFWNHVQFRAGLAPHMQQQRATKNEKAAAANKAKIQARVQAKKAGVKGGTPAKPANPDKSANRRANNRANKRNKMKKQKAAGQGVVVGSRIVVGPGLVTGVVKNAPNSLVKNPMAAGSKVPAKNIGRNAGKAAPKGKRPHSPDRSQGGAAKKFVKNKPTGKAQGSKASPASPTPQQSNKMTKPNKPKVSSPLKKNPLARVPPRGQAGNALQRRKRAWGKDGANMRGHPAPEKRMREQGHHPDLRARLSEGRMDPALMAQVQEQQMLLNMAQQRLGGQGQVDVDTAKQLHNMLNIVLEQTNKLQRELPRSVWDRIAPLGNTEYSPHPDNVQRDPMVFRNRFIQDGPQDMIITAPNREFDHPNQGPMPLFPNNRPPLQPHQVMPAGISRLDIPPLPNARGRPERSQGRDYRKQQNQGGNWHRQNQFEKNRGGQQTINNPPPLSTQLESNIHGSSPKRPLLSPPRLNIFPQQSGELRRPHSPPRRQMTPPRLNVYPQQSGDLRRPQSPPGRQMTPPRRPVTPLRNQGSNEIFQRRPAALQGRQQQQNTSDAQRRGVSPPRNREQTLSSRPLSPARRYGDEWDIPNRGTIDQGNWQSRQVSQQQQQRSNDRSSHRPSNPPNWDSSMGSDRFRKNANQDKEWMGARDLWNSKTSSMKPQGHNEKQWGGGGQGSSGDWNGRGMDNYGQVSNSRMDSRRDGNKDKEDWSDLPEDARDPWGDDGGSKSRWQQGDKGSSSNWGRDGGKDKMDQNWSNKSSGNWQNKGMSMSGNKGHWPSMGNQNQNDQRWSSMSDVQKKSLGSDNWQGNSNPMSSWRPQQNYSGYGQQQRQNTFGSNYKDGR